MNNRGFTLIELLVTIILLGIISAISYVSINETIKKSKINDCKNIINNIKSATKEYISDNRYDPSFANNDYQKIIKVEDLNNYLNGSIVNPFTKATIDKDKLTISVELNNNYTFKNIKITYNDNEIDCENSTW